MLKEFAENIPITLSLSAEEFQRILTQDFVNLIQEKCDIDLKNSSEFLSSAEIENVVCTTREICNKIFENTQLSKNQKIFLFSSLLCKIFDLWKISNASELFFIKIFQNFSPAEIVSAFSIYARNIENLEWTANFFIEHKKILPEKNKKIRTIFIYGVPLLNGGIARYLSIVIPKYIQMGYRIIFFTEKSESELEYGITPPPRPVI